MHLAAVTAEELQNYILVLLANVHIRMLVAGNIYKAVCDLTKPCRWRDADALAGF
jgi:hypothetical protein